MISQLKGKNVDAWLWTDITTVESGALTQLRNITTLPWVFHHLAVMPDVHWGNGATVGSVIAMKDAVAPAAVGVDIGCGMAAVQLDLRAEDPKGKQISDPILCHHNYLSHEKHFGEDVYVTRKGAINAEKGKLGIIPGSMGTKSYIVRGLGNPDSFNSASHGAGRVLSRGAAKRKFSRTDLEDQTKGVECRKDSGVIDEILGAYKDIQTVIDNQKDLVEVVCELKQVLCVKG